MLQVDFTGGTAAGRAIGALAGEVGTTTHSKKGRRRLEEGSKKGGQLTSPRGGGL